MKISIAFYIRVGKCYTVPMRKKWKDNGIDLLSGGLLMLAAVICFLLSFRYVWGDDIWYDEVFSMGFIKEDIRGLAALTAMDVHPPFYYIYLKAVVTVICSAFDGIGAVQAAKIASLLPWIGLMALAVFPLRKNRGYLTAGLFLLLVSAMPQITAYYTEIRMYSLALLLVTCQIMLSVKIAGEVIYNGRVRVIYPVLYVIVGIITAYIQYYACIAVAGSYIALVCLILLYGGDSRRRALGGVLGCAVISIILYAPWLPKLKSQMDNISGNYWIQPLTLKSICGCAKYLTLPVIDISPVIRYAAAGCILLAILYISILYLKGVKKGSFDNEGSNNVIGQNGDKYDITRRYTINSGLKSEAWMPSAGIYDIIIMLCTLMPLVTVVISGFVLSAMGTPIFVYRYMIPAAGGLWLYIAAGVNKERRVAIRMLLVCAFIAVCALNMKGYCLEEQKKTDQAGIAGEALARIPNGSVIVTNFDHVTAVMGERMRNDRVILYDNEIDRLIPMMYGNVSDGLTDDELKELLDAGERVYFFGSFNSREDIVDHWRELKIGSELTDSIMVERYWINIYRLYNAY